MTIINNCVRNGEYNFYKNLEKNYMCDYEREN